MCKINDNITVKQKRIFAEPKLFDGVVVDIYIKEKEDMFGDEYIEKTIFVRAGKKIIKIDNTIPKFLQFYEIVK